MSKKKIAIIAAVAIIVIGGAAAAVPIAKKMSTGAETTVADTSVYDEYNYYPDDYSYSEDEAISDTEIQETASEESTTAADSSVMTTIKQVAEVTTKAAKATTAKNNTTKKSVIASKTTTKKATTTTKKATTTKKTVTYANGVTSTEFQTVEGSKLVDKWQNTDEALLGYKKSSDGYYYCDDKDCWQKGAGYNEVYDQWAPVAAMYIDQVRIRFTYGGKDWMVQLWKGQYGWLLVGAEIGLYTAECGSYTGTTGDVNHYDCAGEEDWLYMQLDCYWAQNNSGVYKKVFTRPYDLYWWATGFVKGQLTKYSAPRTELKTRNRITFKDVDMANIFITGLKNSGFVRAASADQLVDDSYYQSGKDVWVLWSTKSHDCFVGY